MFTDNAQEMLAAAKAVKQNMEMRSRPTTGDRYWTLIDRGEYPADGISYPWPMEFSRTIHDVQSDGVPLWMPDDYRYEFAVESLDAIIECDGEYEESLRYIEEIHDTGAQVDEWYNSHGLRRDYVQDVANDGLITRDHSHTQARQYGMARERSEVFGFVWQFLQETMIYELLKQEA